MTTTWRRKKRPTDGDSPITVGGGGGRRARNFNPDEVRIDLDRNHYDQDGDLWSNPKLELASLKVNNKDVTVSTKTGIVITYRRGVFPGNTIRINEGVMGVRFFQDHLPYDPDPTQLQHHGKAEITGLKVGVNDIDVTPKMTIEAHTRFKRRSPKGNRKRAKSTGRRK